MKDHHSIRGQQVKTVTKTALLLALAAIAITGFAPAGAASAYHMNGQGSITLGGAGLPACLPAVGQPDCANVDIPFSWGALTVQGAGPLQDQPVGGQYVCDSEGSVGGTAFLSKIRGNTSNFELTFNFACTRSAGVGPANINGWFSNVAGSATAPYKSVAVHPHPTPVAKGVFSFKGYFAASNIHPYSIGASNGDAMTCGGGFAPTATSPSSATRIIAAAFVGLCTAAE